jgi:hypothetical protein
MEPRRRGHRWQPIEDLPHDLGPWRSTELVDLIAAWHRRRQELPAADVEAFLARLVRSWSIETGILERIYTLDESVTKTLVELGFDATLVGHGSSDLPAGELIAILDDHRAAAEGLFAFVAGKRELGTSYVKELQARLLAHQETAEAIDSLGNLVRVPLLRGEYKRLPNNPADRRSGAVVHEYCPPEQVDGEMERLVAMHSAHREVPYEVEAAWLHHRFTQIHPFQDGNGRVARCLATLVCLRAGSLPLRVDRGQKVEYIRALEAADAGDLGPLVVMFRDQQRRVLLEAMQLVTPSRGVTAESALREAAQRLASRSQSPAAEVQGGAAVAMKLSQVTSARFRELALQVASVGGVTGSRAYSSSDLQDERLLALAVAAARELGFQADRNGSRPWDRIRIEWSAGADRAVDIVVVIHAVAETRANVHAVVAFLAEAGAGTTGGVFGPDTSIEVLARAPFTFTTAGGHDPQEIDRQFRPWLEAALVAGLDAWRRRI